ncbi:uncharacterized protein LOC116416365 [Nasonia vitripennis]|uniref:Uncharacterized protein n=1 Tax=Nasonia vitripennis TaxID=7425 RepID=A0A7M7Q389_NASVI|nr:uncharacterized protein LOC116416365 [Nasonia vitripennis]
MIYSHNLAYTFFTSTVKNLKIADCKLLGYQWDGSYKNALEISHEIQKSNQCSNCLEMGINAVNHQTQIRRYLVITSASTPYCQLTNDDESLITKAIDKLKSDTALFPQLPSNPLKNIFSSEWLNFGK